MDDVYENLDEMTAEKAAVLMFAYRFWDMPRASAAFSAVISSRFS